MMFVMIYLFSWLGVGLMLIAIDKKQEAFMGGGR
jgi:hypothetical protein